MSIITLTYGLPASGKSTWAKQQVNEANGRLVRINMDDIRNMLGFGSKGPLAWNKALEQTALAIQDQAILSVVAENKDVVVDNTHINSNMPKRIKKLFDGDVLFKIQDFTSVSAGECIARDQKRAGIDPYSAVGANVIRGMAKQLDRPWRLTEDFMNDVVLSAPLEFIPGLPWCIVWDTDGTTAKHVARSPYEYHRVLTDAPHNDVLSLKDIILDGAPEIPHLGMSGRPDTCRTDTEEWNRIHQIYFNDYHMREGTDKRNDSDVKQEMVDKYIRGKYNILAWFDDRNRVVRRLRKLGIRVYQVAEGNF